MFLHTMGLGYIKYLGKELADTAIPLKDWVASGLPVALGSDAPVNSFNPLLGIWHAVTRKEKTTGQVIGGGQRITREEALRCYTIRGAYISFEEHLKGSIEIGKLADLVVLSDDILTCPEDEIRNIQTELTMVDGKVVHGT
jgi:predicted amidohydrolase YtcJ